MVKQKNSYELNEMIITDVGLYHSTKISHFDISSNSMLFQMIKPKSFQFENIFIEFFPFDQFVW
jgi:hypothetical protein